VAEAEAVLDRDAPDDVAIVPGLLPWARAGVAAARKQREQAESHMRTAIAAARDAGCWLVELGYLTYLATEVLDVAADAAATEALARRIEEAIAHVDAPRLLASAEATLALLRPTGPGLLEHAHRLRSQGLTLAAVRLADEARAVTASAPSTAPSTEAEASRLAAELRGELGLAEPIAAAGSLTRREAEVAALARGGLTDREIADQLVVSVRTVETHLTRVYRKLGITSRRELAPH
jgi:DNA-binding CsgD family transcriptional regulator